MAKKTAPKPLDTRLSVRLGERLKTTLSKAVRRTGHEESDLARVALAHLFATKTDEEITAAVIEFRSRDL